MSTFPPDYPWPSHALPASLGPDTGQRCSYCWLPIVWGVTKNGKRCPYDPEPPSPSHWITCPKRKEAARALKAKKPRRDEILERETIAGLRALGYTAAQAKHLQAKVSGAKTVEDAIKEALRHA